MTEAELRAYLDARISDSRTYRGLHVAQHNRIGPERLTAILEGVAQAADSRWFIVPPGDDPAPSRTHDPAIPHPLRATYPDYFSVLDAITRAGVPVTFNSLKKNHFPNLDDMGLLERQEMSRGNFRARLTSAATDIVTESDERTRQGHIGRARERLFASRDPAFLRELFELLGDISTLSDTELMLFVSDRDQDRSKHQELIRAYRRMALLQRVVLLSEYERRCDATIGLPKVKRLDWGNWRNQAQQIISLLQLVTGFVVPEGAGERVVVRSDRPVPSGYTRTRSNGVKDKALALHSLTRQEGWELHHIVPIEYATCDAEMQLIDSPENLLCLTKEAHRQFPTTGNTTIKLGAVTATEVHIEDLAGRTPIVLEIDIDVFLDPRVVHALKNYNARLLASMGS